MRPEPKFSILIPYFEKEDSLIKILDFLNSHPDWIEEIIVVCDGSKPPQIAEKKCTLIEFSINQGLSWTRNELLLRSRGDNIVFLDADAIPQESFFESIAKDWDRKSFFAGREIDSREQGYSNLYRSRFLVQTLGDQDLFPAPFFMGICFGGPRQNFLDLGGFHEGFRNHGEDLEFSFRARKERFRIQYLSSLMVFHDRDDTPSSLRRMIRNHARFQVFAHLVHGISIINVLWQALLWIPVTAWSSFKRTRSPLFSLFSVFHSAYALLFKLLALIEFKSDSYEPTQLGHIFGSQHQKIPDQKP